MPLPDTDIDSPFDMRNAKRISGDPMDRLLPTAEDAAAPKEQDKLDSDWGKDLHSWSTAVYIRELRRQEDNRAEMAKDEAFDDHDQWEEQDKRDLQERGQVPIVYNVTKTTIQWIVGSEKRSRTDYKVLPRRKDAAKAAERKSQLLKYLADVNRSQFHVSRAFEDAVKVGAGWLECGAQSDTDGEPVYDRYESWRNMLWDSSSTELDLSDARYVLRVKWVDLDIAMALFPNRHGTLKQAAIESSNLIIDATNGDTPMDSREIEEGIYRTDREDFAHKRERVRLVEMWYRKPAKVEKIKGGDFNGQVYGGEGISAGHDEEIGTGRAVVIATTMMRMHVVIFTDSGLLWASQSPYRHNDFPFTPIWCYRRGSNGMPYGVIRGLRDIQVDINKRASKALHILSTNKVIMDEGAVDDLDEFAEEVARPNAIIVKKRGHELKIDAERELSTAHLELMSRSIAMIQSVSGVTDENLGRKTNATSGIAIGRRQEQGALTTASIFDNLRFASQVHGEKKLSMVEEFFTEERSFRITNMRGSPEYITVNDGLPENDIVRSKADFIISEDDWRASVRQAQTAELLELLQQLAPVAPQVALVMLDLLIEAMDIPNRDEIVKRIRQATGMRDPDAEEMTPEEIAKEQEAQRRKEMADRNMAAEIAIKEAKATLTVAQAEKAGADVKKIIAAIVGDNVGAQRAALEAALLAIGAPHSVGVADGMLHEAGFKGRTENEDDAMHDAALAAREAQDQALAEEQAMAEAEAQAAQQGPQPGAPPEAQPAMQQIPQGAM